MLECCSLSLMWAVIPSCADVGHGMSSYGVFSLWRGGRSHLIRFCVHSNSSAVPLPLSRLRPFNRKEELAAPFKAQPLPQQTLSSHCWL